MNTFDNYLFIIYSHKKNLEKADIMYKRFFHGVVNVNIIKPFIIYGDNIDNDYQILENKYIVLNVPDNYLNLHLKTYYLFRAISILFPNIKGCFKCDDDIIFNQKCIDTFLSSYVSANSHYVGYKGYCAEKQNNISQLLITPNFQEDCSNIIVNTPESHYCTGPLYYLSNYSMKLFEKTGLEEIQNIVYEDVMVGYILNKHNIFPLYYEFYADEIIGLNHGMCFHNNHKKRTLFMKIHGGLGNQMFQIASGYGIALKNNMNFVIVNSSNVSKNEFTHTKDNNFYFKNIFIHFPALLLETINLQSMAHFYHKEEACFIYEPLEFEKDRDVYFNGYLQNEKYFSHCKNYIINAYKNNSVYLKTIQTLENNHSINSIKNGYFIHIRRGDYITTNSIYEINYDNYFTNAINYIKSIDSSAHFCVFSDDMEYCTSYKVLESLNKTFCYFSDLESIYGMSMCFKGGICSNSTFSWWGSYLNENPNKIVVFPNKWIKKPWTIDIYYENSVVISDQA